MKLNSSELSIIQLRELESYKDLNIGEFILVGGCKNIIYEYDSQGNWSQQELGGYKIGSLYFSVDIKYFGSIETNYVFREKINLMTKELNSKMYKLKHESLMCIMPKLNRIAAETKEMLMTSFSSKNGLTFCLNIKVEDSAAVCELSLYAITSK